MTGDPENGEWSVLRVPRLLSAPFSGKSIEENGDIIARCEYCGRKNVLAVPLIDLTPLFDNFLRLLEEDPTGDRY